MSRIGSLPIEIKSGITIGVDGRKVSVKGPNGEIVINLPVSVEARVEGNTIVVDKKGNSKLANALHGTYRAHLANAVLGVSDGHKRELEIIGTGYKAETTGKKLTLTVGFSHPVVIDAPEGVTFRVEKTLITVEGVDKTVVGQVAANIRKVRPPEPYKGKGIRYQDEVVRRKAGKAAKTAGA